MSTLTIETFDGAGAREMNIDLPASVLDLNTRIITTKEGVVIKHADFWLTGQTMEFNTETKQGRLGGKVHMTIYDLQNETIKPSEEPSPAK
jgi:lipopolysaccharide export system protein LptC